MLLMNVAVFPSCLIVRSSCPDILSWVEWCYRCAGELQFGSHRILFTTGVRRGGSLGPLLFHLSFLDFLSHSPNLNGWASYGIWMIAFWWVPTLLCHLSYVFFSSRVLLMVSVLIYQRVKFFGPQVICLFLFYPEVF